MSKYKLVELTQNLIDPTKESWQSLIGEDAFSLEFGLIFDWVEAHMQAIDGDSLAKGMLNNDTGQIAAFVEIVSGRKGQMHKLLKVVPSPYFWDVTTRRLEVIELYIDVFFSVLSSHGFKSLHKVKIYGRSDEMMSLLKSIHSLWSIPGSSAEFEGRFLSIHWK